MVQITYACHEHDACATVWHETERFKELKDFHPNSRLLINKTRGLGYHLAFDSGGRAFKLPVTLKVI